MVAGQDEPGGEPKKSIDIFPWNDNFNTGIQKIDEQHKKLVQLLNLLASHVAFHSDIPSLNIIFDELADYAIYHFQTEEQIWHEYLTDDPLEAKHKEIHSSFILKVIALKKEESTTPANKVVEDVLSFLTSWLASHILENDRYMAMVVLAIQSGMPLESARIDAKEKMSGSTRVLIDIIISIYESLSSNTLQLMRELAEHKRQDKLLHRNQKLIQSMLENSPIATRIATSSGRNVIFANKRYAKLINSEPDRVIGADPKQYYANPKDYEDTLNQLDHGIPVTDKLVELSIPGAGTVWALSTYLKVEYEDEPAILGWFYDVTEIREVGAQLQLLTANVSDLISRHDLGGKYLFVTPACVSLQGYEEGELLGHSCYEFFHPEDVTRIQATHRQILENPKETFTISYRLRRKDGSYIWVESTVRATMSDENKIIDIVAATRDITERKRTDEALRLSELRLRTIIETEPECVKVVDGRGRLLEMNAAGLAMLEADTLEVAKTHTLLDYVVPEDRAAFMSLHHRVMDGESGVVEFKIKGLKGASRYLETHATPLRDATGNITALLGITRDVTEIRRIEQQQRIAATAFESQEGMIVTDAAGSILQVNRAFTHITGYSSEDVIGKNPHMLSSGRHDVNFYKIMWEKINRTGEWEGEIWNRRKNGEAYPEHLTITAVKDSEGNIANYVATLTDITASKASEEEIRNLAFFDPLTKLPNRRLLQDRLQQAIASRTRSGKEAAILFIDLDNFKSLNDTLGHDIGDVLLAQVAERLVTCVREGDTVARLGGDEFVMMLEDLSEDTLEAAEQTEAVGNKILTTLSQPYALGTHVHNSTPSIGITLFNNNKSIEELMKQADIAMYQAKKGGRNTLRFFDPRMQQSISARMALEVELRNSLDKQQFQLYYQIQVDSAHHPLGAEALIRWIHPERGLVPPSEFIPTSEEIGLIFPIGWWVLETACAQLKTWQMEPSTCNLILSVNVSAKQFRQADFVDQMKAVVQHYGINPTLLKLELTESMLVEDIEDVISIMTALSAIGVRISLDDFGTGFSSLQYLKRLPLSQLKIDQSFVRDIATDSSDKAIVTTIIAMAHSLSLDVIAEGVETEEQRQFLENAGCNHFQGYLFSKPVPIEQFESLINCGRQAPPVNFEI